MSGLHRCSTCGDVISPKKMTVLSDGTLFCYRDWLTRLDAVAARISRICALPRINYWG